jgi:hypothetical protein
MAEEDIDVNDLYADDRYRLNKKVESAISKAPYVDIVNGRIINPVQSESIWKRSDKPDRIILEFRELPNSVHLEETHSHLLPHLIKTVRARIDYISGFLNKKELKTYTESMSKHEFSHLAFALATNGIKSKLGVSVYKVNSIDGKPSEGYVLYPFVAYEGECDVEDFLAIVEAPGHEASLIDNDIAEKIRKDYGL